MKVPAVVAQEALARFEMWCRDQGFPTDYKRGELWPSWPLEDDLRALGAEVRRRAGGVVQVVIARRCFFPHNGTAVEMSVERVLR